MKARTSALVGFGILVVHFGATWLFLLAGWEYEWAFWIGMGLSFPAILMALPLASSNIPVMGLLFGNSLLWSLCGVGLFAAIPALKKKRVPRLPSAG